ncbi:MAG TPA: tetratricopeptide repeat protein, partial [Candidatus Dormibacteraeota bacterium]|nr:tetratricopeptide repeat protein [Candidatus Dormibacteraeota bacterium]
ELDPYSYSLWGSLADAYEASGQTERARRAYEKAQAAYPVSAEMAWQFGSFLLRQGEFQAAAEQVHRALENKPELAASAVSQFWKAGVGLDPIFQRVLPAEREDYLAALNYFVSQQNSNAALASWERLAGLGKKVPLNDSLDLTGNLIALDRFADAARVWRQALALSGRGSETGSGGSLIFNGGFEQALVNGGFGWRWIPTAGAILDLVGDVTHRGAQSARITFDGTANADFGGLRQYVAIGPRERYRFSAYMRTDSISSDSGPQFVIWSCTSPVQTLAQTSPMTGTHPWTEVQAVFTAGENVSCVDVVLLRKPSQAFDAKIQGTVWVDDVRLVPVPAGGGSPR